MIEFLLVLAIFLASPVLVVKVNRALDRRRHAELSKRIAALEAELDADGDGLIDESDVEAIERRATFEFGPKHIGGGTVLDLYGTHEIPRPPDPPKKKEIFKPPVLDDDYFAAKREAELGPWGHGYSAIHPASYYPFAALQPIYAIPVGPTPSYYGVGSGPPPLRLVG